MSIATPPPRPEHDRGPLTSEARAHATAARLELEYVDLGDTEIDPAAVTLVTPKLARDHRALPVGFVRGRALRVAMQDPEDISARDAISLATGMEIVRVVVSATALDAVLDRLERIDAHLAAGLNIADVGEEPAELAIDLDDEGRAPVIRLVHAVLADAIDRGASDVHFQPTDGDMEVLLRVDGILMPASTIARRLAPSVVSRLKIMGDMDISERRLPQDGRIGLTIDGRAVDLRVATVPVVRGEAVVVRVLDAVRGPVSLSGTGMLDADVEALEHALSRAHGAVLVTGPTGSGKTTTLYGALSILHTGARSILTIEDPVEYEIPGIKQMQVNPRAGLQFATGLRSLMRADPDVIMVGEVRDRETAQITIEAALTGHLVLTTLHTNDAASTPVRLIEMGVAPFLVASAVTCVVAQRLVRRLCPACRREAIVPAEIMRGQGFAVDADARVWEPVGCDLCGHTGYRGRIGVFEVLQMTDEVRRCVLARKHASEVREAATAAGTRTLRDDGLEKVMHGETTLTEILRVAG